MMKDDEHEIIVVISFLVFPPHSEIAGTNYSHVRKKVSTGKSLHLIIQQLVEAPLAALS